VSWLDLVDQIAALVGIEPWYYDLRGTRHDTSLGTKLLVLSALKIDIASIPVAKASLAALEEESWRSLLAPVIVERTHSPSVALFVPAADVGRVHRWRMTFESGECAQGEFRPESLPLLGTRAIDGKRIEHRRLALSPGQLGYHQLTVAALARQWEGVLAIAPERCFLPACLAGEKRAWGVAAHLYTLRSGRNWGVGDFSDLAGLGAMTGKRGGAAVAVNPFHALFPERADEPSPYSPSSRRFLNPIYIDPGNAPDGKALGALQAPGLVDYPAVWRAKTAAFAALFAKVDPDAKAVCEFAREQGAPLQHYATFCALAEKHGLPWRQWPVEFQRLDSAQVVAFAREQKDRIAYHGWLQYLADTQLKEAAEEGRRAGLEIGIIRDLAMGISPDGADAWSQQGSFVADLRCGAPPDDFQPKGQEWGILPLHPLALKRDPMPVAELLRANMRHAGGLRIDHVIGLQRQFLVPLGGEPKDGCYVRFPFEELTGILALESQRNQCFILGEDLGTVPEGFRERMADMDVFGCDLLYFERTRDGGFKAPADYRRKAAVSIGTHDLPTFAGYWEGRDIDLRRRLGIYDDPAADAAETERARERLWLLEALATIGSRFRAGETPSADALLDVVHAFLVSSTAQLFLAKLDDLFGEREQLNLPGTTTAHPNWRRKLTVALDTPAFAKALDGLATLCASRATKRL
jgi:4-alpha-glucanotransferase